MQRISVVLIIPLLLFSLILTTVADESCNTLKHLDLPHDDVTFYAWDATDAYFNFSFSYAGADVKTKKNYSGWCVQKEVQMTRGIPHAASLYSSYADLDNIPEYFANVTESEVTWQKINYLINNREGVTKQIIQDIIWNLTKEQPLTEDAKIFYQEINWDDILPFCPELGDKIVILVNTNDNNESHVQHAILELPLIKDENTDNTQSGANPRGNTPPTADGSKNTPFQGVVTQPLTFDGSKSYDYDGQITSWNWSFGDGTTALGEIITHSYTQPGTYQVYLNVTDNDGSMASYETTAVIIQPNRPPEKPTIIGQSICDKQTTYTYTVVTTDVDNDTVKYTIDWGDNDPPMTTAFYPNNTEALLDHRWANAGVFTLKVFAEDSSAALSATGQQMIFVDVTVNFVDDELHGYFIDTGKNGVIDSFHDNETGTIFQVTQDENGWVFLDYNSDGNYDYQFHRDEGLSIYIPPEETSETSWLGENLLYIIIIGVIAAIVVFFIFFEIEFD